jgi:N utilization substance protein B
LDILFESTIRGTNPVEVLADAAAAATASGAAPANEYTAELVNGIAPRLSAIDDIIAQFSRGWDVERMPTVDLCILRIGVYELLCGAEVPGPVAISEAVELAGELSTDDSPAFVNGVLAAVAQTPPTLA